MAMMHKAARCGSQEQMCNPLLPPELERAIFELASVSNKEGCGWSEDILSILLVARRVYHWVKPILYCVFKRPSTRVKRGEDFPDSPTKLEDVGFHVRRVLFNGDVEEDLIQRVFKFCPNLEDFALWHSPFRPRWFPLISQPQGLRLLSANLSVLVVPMIYQQPIFHNLTHLDVVASSGIRWIDCWKQMARQLLSLTHLSINEDVEVEVLAELLVQCLRLCLLIVLKAAAIKDENERSIASSYLDVDDTRLILIEEYYLPHATQDWENCAYGRYDLWDFGASCRDARNGHFFQDNKQRWLTSPVEDFDWTTELNEQGIEWYESKWGSLGKIQPAENT